jgi:hypothetical protein
MIMRLPLVITMTALLALTTAIFPASAAAQQPPVDPVAIVLTPDDLPPGFTIVEDETTTLGGDLGVMLNRQMQREANPETIQSGPVAIAQIVARVDRLLVPTDLLDELGKSLVSRQGLLPTPEGPNEPGRFSLSKVENYTALFAYGFVKDSIVIVTIAAGLTSVVNLNGTVALSEVSAARYSSIVAAGSLQAPPLQSGVACQFVKGSGPAIYRQEGAGKRELPDWDTYLRLGGDPSLTNVCQLSESDLEAIPTL